MCLLLRTWLYCKSFHMPVFPTRRLESFILYIYILSIQYFAEHKCVWWPFILWSVEVTRFIPCLMNFIVMGCSTVITAHIYKHNIAIHLWLYFIFMEATLWGHLWAKDASLFPFAFDTWDECFQGPSIHVTFLTVFFYY